MDSQINNNTNSVNSSMNPVSGNKHISTVIGILVIIFAAVFLIGGGFLHEYFENSQVPAVVSPSPMVENSDAQTAGWKTYTNTDYAFQIDYPESLSPEKYSENGLYSVVFHSKAGQDNINGYFQVIVMPESSILNYYQCDASSLLSKQPIGYDCSKDCSHCSNITQINNYKALRFEEMGGGFHYVLKNKNNYFKIAYFAPGVFNQSDADKMLSTFKFTDSNSNQSSITITSPNGDIWKIGEKYTISWNPGLLYQAGCHNFIALQDMTGKNVGIISNGLLSLGQTSLVWNTKDMYDLSCGTGAQNVIVVPGTYRIALTELGSGDDSMPNITAYSNYFTITQ